jgi:predicted membrane protein
MEGTMTADQPRVRVTTNLAFGICLILLGTVLILDRLQLVQASELLRFWPVALVLIGLALVVQSFQRPDTTTGAKREELSLGTVVFWLLISVFVWNGFSLNGFSALSTSRTETATNAVVVGILGRDHRVINSAEFRGGQMTSIMGRSEIDLRTAAIAPGQDVAIQVFALMGAATIRVPEGWSVDVDTARIVGDVKDRRTGTRDSAGAPRLIIRGFIMMGGMTIRS